MRFTQDQVNAFEARQRRTTGAAGDTAGVELESKLHEQITAECRRRMWPVIHSRMDAPTTTIKGVADFVVFADGGRVFNIEAKRKGGKQSTDQMAWEIMLKRNGHHYAVVTSFEQFLKEVEL